MKRGLVLLNCRNFLCTNNRKGICCLEKVTLQNDNLLFVNKVTCIEAAEKEEDSDLKNG